jgi:hypothetical protein
MAQRRDSKGRFAGSGGKAPTSGSISTATRATTTGARARRNAASMKQEQSGAKNFASERSRASRNVSKFAKQESGEAAKFLHTSARGYTRQAAATRKKGKAMERERRSLLRRGSMRGGG